MPRFTISVPDEIDEWLTAAADDDGPYDSKSKAASEHLALARRIDHLDEDFDDILERAARADELERQVTRLENEKQTLIRNREEHTELVEYVERERELDRRREQRREAPIWRRAKWYVLGEPAADDD